ncbi:MAG: hypothetical protein ACFFBY_05795 [Promethearchaeota archaeon]
MIICSNCGTTNPSNERICRTCGALLPISSKAPRMKIGVEKKSSKPTKSKRASIKGEDLIKPSLLELQEIPKEYTDPEMDDSQVDAVKAEIGENKEILKEITPRPFKGSIIASKAIFGTPTPKKQKKVLIENNQDLESTLIKQKQLEEDMTKVLKFLSKKVTVEKLPTEKKREGKKQKEAISPSSMNEILKELLKLDLHIEASAIIKKDGTILASAISSRISDSLFATIGQSLSLIGLDIIESLSAGKLLNISVRGTHGVLDLAPIDNKIPQFNDMILVILSNPKVKSGIIHFAANIVKKQIKDYLGFAK